MSPFRPDLVDCWMYRIATSARSVESIEVLLLRRAPGRILPGLWQCVSGLARAGRAHRHRSVTRTHRGDRVRRGGHRGVLRPRPGQPVP